jgi:HSP20 family protein
MADFGTKRQRSDEQASSGMTPPERTEGLTRRQNQGLERNYGQGRYFPSVFSVSPGEFFTMSPVTLMRRLTEDIDRALGLSSGLGQGNLLDVSERDIAWVPAVEVTQSGNNLVIKADLPGLNESDIKLEATEDGLVIQGERKREDTREEGGWRQTERVYGRFYRLIPLPENAKLDEVKANFRNGVLEVVVPVPELEKKHRQIPIQTSGQASSQEQGSSTEGRSRTAASSGSGR